MAEDTFVQMLLEVAGGQVADERDVGLARAAARWAVERGHWQAHLSNGFFFEIETLTFWILVNRVEQVLEIRTRLAAGKGWLVHARHRIAHVGQGLDVLATEGLLPPRFSALGRQALDDYAEAMDRAAAEMASGRGFSGSAEDRWEMQIRAVTMNRAADQARAFPRAELAVMHR